MFNHIITLTMQVSRFIFTTLSPSGVRSCVIHV